METFIPQKLTRSLNFPLHVVGVLVPANLWHPLLRRLEYLTGWRVLHERPLTVRHVHSTNDGATSVRSVQTETGWISRVLTPPADGTALNWCRWLAVALKKYPAFACKREKSRWIGARGVSAKAFQSKRPPNADRNPLIISVGIVTCKSAWWHTWPENNLNSLNTIRFQRFKANTHTIP